MGKQEWFPILPILVFMQYDNISLFDIYIYNLYFYINGKIR